MSALKALTSQLLGWVLALVAATLHPPLLATPLWLAALQAPCAALIGILMRSDHWWGWIHLGFAPALVLATYLHLPPIVWLTALSIMVLVYWGTFRGDVPLFLTNKRTAHTLADFLPAKAGATVVDLGVGTGSVLALLARLRPDLRFVGVEKAPLPFLIARLTCRKLPNCKIIRDDLWQHSLNDYDVVYAFLSPHPMMRLWNKACEEMRPGSALISNSFPVPNIFPDHIREVNDRRHTKLYCYYPHLSVGQSNKNSGKTAFNSPY